ncbi:hypothetical protein [Chlamydia crocodili]
MVSDISDGSDKKHEQLQKEYKVFISSTQKELDSIQSSINKNKKLIDQYQDSLNRQQKEIEALNAKKSKKS